MFTISFTHCRVFRTQRTHEPHNKINWILQSGHTWRRLSCPTVFLFFPSFPPRKTVGRAYRYVPSTLNAGPAEIRRTVEEKVLVTGPNKKTRSFERVVGDRSGPKRHPLSYQEGRLLLIKVGVSARSHAGFTALNEGTGQRRFMNSNAIP